MNDIALIDSGGKTVQLYQKMQTAIADCYSVDDCKAIADQAAAIAAYHKQIKDDESVRKFLLVKLRAWRRIGELLTKVESGGDSMSAHTRKIRAAFDGSAAVEEMSDDAIRQAIRCASLPIDFFERNVGEHTSIASLFFAYERLQREQWLASPQGQKATAIAAKEAVQWKKEDAKRHALAVAQAEHAQQEQLHLHALKTARDEALSEVGITLERRDREHMHEIVFLIKDPIYEALRQAAFDEHTTMQAVLRSGLAMWFLAHGYDVPMDLRPPRQAKTAAPPMSYRKAKAAMNKDSASP